ncbi:SH3 domain-containing protein [Streptomyces pactum]|uniref:SH3 domain-containing protein n=1 Tax=Streptomyces pactum TaxID=68249 RepID=A0ABS0NMJ6_9ACTN|nr:SH3 domain-containing protein [Streptomyces pactum]MBH5336420.1 SH3 domain-containing protein [Streptomyces pactum]
MAIKGKASMVALTVALTLGGAVGLAPSASAAGSVGASGCHFNSPDVNFTVDVKSTALRKGPGTRYGSKGTIRKGTTFRYYCRTWAGGGLGGFNKSWSYGKIVKRSGSGVKVGTLGWVKSRYLD